jgi:hypothetical protein
MTAPLSAFVQPASGIISARPSMSFFIGKPPDLTFERLCTMPPPTSERTEADFAPIRRHFSHGLHAVPGAYESHKQVEDGNGKARPALSAKRNVFSAPADPIGVLVNRKAVPFGVKRSRARYSYSNATAWNRDFLNIYAGTLVFIPDALYIDQINLPVEN